MPVVLVLTTAQPCAPATAPVLITPETGRLVCGARLAVPVRPLTTSVPVEDGFHCRSPVPSGAVFAIVPLSATVEFTSVLVDAGAIEKVYRSPVRCSPACVLL